LFNLSSSILPLNVPNIPNSTLNINFSITSSFNPIHQLSDPHRLSQKSTFDNSFKIIFL
jgi:hypothetical protein